MIEYTYNISAYKQRFNYIQAASANLQLPE